MVTRLIALLLAMHPLHTTMTDVSIDAGARRVRAVTRVFLDDMRKAFPTQVSPDTYLVRRLVITDAGSLVQLHSCGVKHSGDVAWICVEGSFKGSVAELRLSNELLCDVFDDQVNVVTVNDVGARRTVMFVKGDRAKSIW